MSEELSVTVSEHEVLPIPAHTHSDEDGRRGGCEIISTAQELLAAEGKAEVEEVSMFLDELKVDVAKTRKSSIVSQQESAVLDGDTPIVSTHRSSNCSSVASSVAEIGEQPIVAPPLVGGCSSPVAEAGRNMLVQYALDAVFAAEDSSGNLTRREVARNYHTAQVYLEVVKAYAGLPPDLDEMLRYCRWCTMRCGHLLQNIVREYVDSDVRLEDHYIIDVESDGTTAELGTGTYGHVMKVKHRGTGKFYAMKAINVTRLEPKQISKLYAEISIMREVDHPHIVRLREVFYTKLQICIVMDLCKGGELFNLVTENPGECASEAEIAQAVRRMMGAIHYLHKHQIVHRDLKLENWLLESPGDLSSIKLIDFGLSKHFSDEEHMHQAVGSTYYVAPEVLLGNYTEKCDLWSMGVITYMMLSGTPPFWGNNDKQIRSRIIRGQYSTSDKVFKNVSKSGLDFISMLLKLDPASRPDVGTALRHPWLMKKASNQTPAKGKLMTKADLSIGLKKYSHFSQFRRTVLNVVARNLPPSELKVLRDTFQSIDVDNSGSLTIDDLLKALRGHLSESEIKEIWKNLTISGMGELDYNEFIAATMWMRLQLDEERLHEAFEAFDDEGKGFLTMEDVERVVGGNLPHEEIQKMMMETDYDGDGKIDYIDFARVTKELAMARDYKPLESKFHRIRNSLRSVVRRGPKHKPSKSIDSTSTKERKSSSFSLSSSSHHGKRPSGKLSLFGSGKGGND